MARLTVVNQRRGVGRGKKIPPEVPRRSSSIKSSESSGSVDRSVPLIPKVFFDVLLSL